MNEIKSDLFSIELKDSIYKIISKNESRYLVSESDLELSGKTILEYVSDYFIEVDKTINIHRAKLLNDLKELDAELEYNTNILCDLSAISVEDLLRIFH